MDNIDAPQWADFLAPSPQVSVDDYFLQKHDVHKYRNKLDSIDSDSDSPNSKQSFSEISFSNETVYPKTPIRVISSKGKSSSHRKNKSKETTYESVLMEAMSNLQTSFKNVPNEKSLNKSCLIDSPAFKTPLKRITRSMCAQSNTPKLNLDEYQISPVHENCLKIPESISQKEDKENINSEEQESPIKEQTSQILLEVTVTSTDHESSHEKLEPELEKNPIESNQEDQSQQVTKSKVVTSFSAQQNTSGSVSTKKKVTVLTGNAWHRQVKRRMSITNQRRLSVTKPPMPSKYISMAEAVTKFHRVTPQRFRSTNVKTTKTEQLRRMSFKLTRATSPALMCKNRTRPVTALSRDEQERLELEKIRQNQIKANPVRKDILRKPAPLKKVEKKMITNPEPFHLTEVKKGQLAKPKTEVNKRINRTHTKTVPSIVSTENEIVVKNEEVLFFGIPVEPCKTKKLYTKVAPFSFEARNKELQMKKLEKLKVLQEKEEQKNKAEFHARPVPTAVKTPMNSKPPQKTGSSSKPKITIARSLSFEERVKQVQKKKEEKIKQILEEEKKARNFKAQKVPEFKPVMVKGRSRDNLLKRSNENLAVIKTNNAADTNKKADRHLKNSRENLAPKLNNLINKSGSIPFVAPKKTTPVSINTENQENRSKGAVPKILQPKCKLSQKSVAVLTELNTDKRAKQRREFDEQMKKKEEEEFAMKQKEDEERIAKEKSDKMELRKMTEIKARPMPVYKPMNILKSKKPLTDAQSPAWTKRKESAH